MAAITKKQQRLLAKSFRLLGWNAKRQQGFCKFVCGSPWPQTTEDGSKVYEGLEAMILRLLKPHYRAFMQLVDLLYRERGEMTAWEQEIFLPDVKQRVQAGKKVTPYTIQKVREIAHKYDVACGFPRLKELAAAQYRQQEPTQ